MSNLQNFLKKPMYQSYCNTKCVEKTSGMENSFIGLNDRKYKYERVGNMFKLVETLPNKQNQQIQSQQKIDRIRKIQESIKHLTSRIVKIEHTVPSLNDKIDEILIDMDSLTCQISNGQNSVNSILEQVNQIRERVEEIEEQQFKYDQSINRLRSMVQSIKEISNEQIQQMYAQLTKSMTIIQEKFSEQLISMQQKMKDSSLNTSDCSLSPIKDLSSVPAKTYQLEHIHQYKYEGNIYKVASANYIIDYEGRVFDEDGYAILDNQNKVVRLNNEHLQKLRQLGILQED